jgi:putative endonuclease
LSFFVYVLVSETTGRRYVGQTEDVERRLAQHNCIEHNRRKYTSRHRGPWKLIHQEPLANRADAMARERWLKSGIGRAWLDEQFGRASPPQAD